LDWLLHIVGSGAISSWVMDVAWSKVMFWALALAVAERIHDKKVKQGFAGIIESINKVALALETNNLQSLERDNLLREDHNQLKARVTKLEGQD
jgi:hypothetical protein